MEGVERRRPLWRHLKQRLGIKGMGCCGSSSWALMVSEMTIREEVHEQGPTHQDHYQEQEPIMGLVDQLRVDQVPSCSGMNLATALAAERHLRRDVVPTPARPLKTLMRLIEETEGTDLNKRRKKMAKEEEGIDSVCCICMERNKGAAFIPCGHTYCRVCSREQWLNRGSCPLCNRSITEVLDIF